MNIGRYPDSKSIFYSLDGAYRAEFKIDYIWNDYLAANEVKLNDIEYSGHIILKNHQAVIGDKVFCEGNLKSPRSFGNFDYKQFLADKNIYKTIECKEIRIQRDTRFNIFRLGSEVKNNLVNKIDNILDKESASYFEGIVLGDKDNFTKYQNSNLVKTGTSHIAALSGFNITIITIFVTSIFSFIPYKLIRLVIVNTLTLMFLIIVGFSDSVIRAYLQFLILSVGIVAGRGVNITRVIALMFIVVLVISPRILFSISFQLSFLATCGLIFFYRQFLDISELKKLEYFSIAKQTLTANLLVLPIMINSFGVISSVSLIVNMLVLPSVEIVSIFGIITCILLFINILDPISKISVILIGFISLYINNVINFFGNFSFAGIHVEGKMTALGIILYYACLISIICFGWIRRNFEIFMKLESVSYI